MSFWSQEKKYRNNRSSHSSMFFKIGVLKIFPYFAVKHLCWNLSLKKLLAFGLSGLQLHQRCFSVIFTKFVTLKFYRTLPVAASGKTTCLNRVNQNKKYVRKMKKLETGFIQLSSLNLLFSRRFIWWLDSVITEKSIYKTNKQRCFQLNIESV